MTGWERLFGALAAGFGLVAVALGAFGAHALQERLEPRALEVFETGVRYQMFHAVALLAVALLVARHGGQLLVASGWSFTAGIVIFSGSLYLLAMTGVGRWGAVTPVGGVAFLAGWLLLAVFFVRGS